MLLGGNSEMAQRTVFSAAAVLLLGLMAVLAGGAAWRESITFDEVSHIAAGLSYVQKADLRLNPEHPPLPKILAAIPLAIRGTKADYSSPAWTQSAEFFPAFLGQWAFGEWVLTRWNDPAGTLAWARAPMLLLTLLLGWVIFTFARRLGGDWGGILCLAVYVASPLFLTFGPLVHTDIAVTLFSLLALWRFAGLWREPTRGNAALFGLCYAGALLSKFTAGLLLLAFAAFAVITRWGGLEAGKPPRRERRRAALRGILWAALAVYGFYFVFSLGQSTGALDRLGHGAALEPLRRALLPPWLYLRGVLMVVVTAIRPTFLLGHAYPHGVWFYFPVLLVLKSPAGFLGLLGVAAGVALAVRGQAAGVAPGMRLHWRIVWVSFATLCGACILSHFDISIRHFSVPLALLILLLAPLPRLTERLRAARPVAGRLAQVGTALLALGCVGSAVRAYPFYFPYVSLFGFGRPAYTLISDSNLDWNQALPEVRRFAERQGLPRIAVDSFGISEPQYVVPQAQLWDCQQPSTAEAGQWVAVSANMILDSHNCAWLMQYPHEPLGGGAMYAVRLPASIPAAGVPGGPPPRAQWHWFLGTPSAVDARTMFREVILHPETIKATMDAAQEKFRGGRK